MNRIILNLLITASLTLATFCLQAQLSFTTVQVPEASGNNVSICDDVVLILNNSFELDGDDCEFNTDFSNMEPGTNTLSVGTDMHPLVNSSTLDLVRIVIALDEGFDSYALAMAADIDSDLVVSTDDLIHLRKLILGFDSEIPIKVKIGPVEYATQPFDGLDLLSDHTTIQFDASDVQDGMATEIVLISVGSL